MASYVVDIDTGGTFTDCIVQWEKGIEWVKTDTTPHDLMEGIINCITEVGEKLGYTDIRKFLSKVELLRISTTYGINTLLQRKGPKLGLVVTRGFEQNIYSDGKSPVVGTILSKEMIKGIDGGVYSDGVAHAKSEEVLSIVKELLDLGARTIVFSLLNSHISPDVEKRVQRIVRSKYPPHYLGYIPIAVSTEISLTPNNALRTNEALLDSYIHYDMKSFLFGGEERLQKLGYRKSVYVVHNAGGVARVPRTKAIMTFYSGPVAGTLGLQFLSKFYGDPNVVGIDIGGTSTDIGIIKDYQVAFMHEPSIAGIPVDLPTVRVKSIGSGGGSIAKIVDGNVKVGPESAGAIPGPVCYDMGGTEPTLTDAFVVLGIISPDNFLGGKRKLNKTKAESAIHNTIADPLGVDTAEAAQKIIESDREKLMHSLEEELSETKIDTNGLVVVSYGGAGGLFTTWLANELGIHRVYIPPFAAVFCAWGMSTVGIKHKYERYIELTLYHNGECVADIDLLNRVIDELKGEAIHEMKLEEIPIDSINFNLLLEISANGVDSWVTFSKSSFDSLDDVRKTCQTVENGETNVIKLKRICLEAIYQPLMPKLPAYPLDKEEPTYALKDEREVYLEGSYIRLKVYEQEKLKPGNVVVGPAIVEGKAATILVLDGQKYSVDKHLFGIVEEVS